MGEYNVEDIDRLLENLQDARRQIEEFHEDTIKIEELYLLSSVVLEVLDWTNTAYGDNSLSISPALLNKFVKMRGTVSKRDALRVSERLWTFLRSQDQGQGQGHSGTVNLEVVRPESRVTQVTTVVTVIPEGWIVVPGNAQIKQKISAISSLLDSIIQQVKHSNAPQDQQVLSVLERQQLIAILETALNLLRSPMIEKGMLKKAGDMLRKNAEKAAEKELQQGLGGLMSVAGKVIGEMIKSLFS